MENKPWWKSKTIIVNSLTALAAALTFLVSPDAKIDAGTVGIMGTVLGVINVLLRLVTNQPVGR